jgi:hypothetical protein
MHVHDSVIVSPRLMLESDREGSAARREVAVQVGDGVVGALGERLDGGDQVVVGERLTGQGGELTGRRRERRRREGGGQRRPPLLLGPAGRPAGRLFGLGSGSEAGLV